MLEKKFDLKEAVFFLTNVISGFAIWYGFLDYYIQSVSFSLRLRESQEKEGGLNVTSSRGVFGSIFIDVCQQSETNIEIMKLRQQ